MKNFKTITLVAAIGMIVYTVYMTTRYIISAVHPTYYHFELWEDIRTRTMFDVLPLSLIIACIALLKQRPKMSASRPLFRILTVSLFIAMFGTLVFSYPYTIQVCGIKYLYPSIYWRVLMLIAGIVWLFMLRQQPTEEASPRSYRVTLIITVLILALPILLEMTSGLFLLKNGYILCLNSFAIKSWVSWIASILPLIHFVFPSIQQINTARNSHCAPGSFNEKTFKLNRIITLVVVGITIVAVIVELICEYLLGHLFYCRFFHPRSENALFITEVVVKASIYTLLAAGIVSWIMLSIMAFRQLPNPRGYTIYNIVCQCLTWGSLIAAIVLAVFDMPIAETFAWLSFFVFCAFFITQTIRVISYTIPNQNPQ